MTTFSGLGLGLSLVFGCLLLALIAELYYLLWWKKKRITDSTRELEGHDYGSFFAKELFHSICWKRTSPQQRKPEPDSNNNGHTDLQDPELGDSLGKDHVSIKPVGDDQGVESELMRLHNLAGPPRFLFTIKEETREDLESEDGRSRKGSRTRSLSDLMVAASALDTPFLTPLASPKLKSPPFAAAATVNNNPLFESSAEAELTRLRSSPPPKFKFLRDAEEKLYRRLMEEAEKRAKVVAEERSDGCNNKNDNNNNNVFTFVVANDAKSGGVNLPQYHSGSSQVLPLASSPTAFKVHKPHFALDPK